MKTTTSLVRVMLALLLGAASIAQSAPAQRDYGRSAVEEEIWALETAYFASLYRADYASVLALVGPRFLAWPGSSPQPIDRDESARFMRQLVPAPTACSVRIERAGIRVLGAVALTQYVLHVDCAGGGAAPRPSRITHTWVKENAKWTLLGGMSHDL